MPKFKKRSDGKGRGQWSEIDMKQAVSSVLENKMSERVAANHYNVPRTSLQRRIKSVLRAQQTEMKPQMGYFKATFDAHYEDMLVKHMRDLDSRLMPLAKTEFLKLAYDLAEALKLPHRFNKEKKMAGKDFYMSFMKRHPELAYRKPQSTSLMRCVGFNKPQVNRFFNQLKMLYDKHSFRPSRIFNADETGVSCVHENDKVITMKGKRQVGKITSGERGRNVTLMFCTSATGQFIPPLFIFPRQRMNDRLMIGAPTESIAFPTSSGWMTTEAFLKWMQHFVSFTKPTKEDPVLLLIDGHGTHKELDVILFARTHHVHMLSFPPHTTHKLQPLDRSFMKPFKDQYNHGCSLWMRANPGARINDYDIAKLVDGAYTKVCRLEIAANGFRCTGIHPFNQDIFTDLDFMGSALTDVENPPPTPAEVAVVSTPVTPRPLINDESIEESVEDSAMLADVGLPTDSESVKQPTFSNVLNEVSPMPSCAGKRVTSRKRKSEKSEILTATPNKDLLIEKKNLEIAKEAAKEVRRKVKFEKYQGTMEKSNANAKEKSGSKKNKNKNKYDNFTNPTPGTSKQDPTTNFSNEDETNCLVCGETFDENWIQCKGCEGWSHELCAVIEDTLYYYCDHCNNRNKV